MLDIDPKVAHLLRRATLGPTIEEVQSASEAGLQPTLNRFLSEFDRPLSQQEAAAQAIGDVFLKDAQSLRAGWMLRMLNSANLFREKLTVFWHGHFATGITKVKNTQLMADQIDTLRGLALGDFKDLVTAMAQDPAMLIWLDNALNQKGHINENFGREVMELFTLGIGNYTEKDVVENARCFTGWNMDGNRFKYYPDRHDNDPKTLLSHTGNFNGDDAIDILVNQPAAAHHISWKLWRFFLSQNPSNQQLQPLEAAYQSGGRRITAVLKTMYTSPDFFDPSVMGNQIKSPVEFTVGLVRQLNGSLDVQLYADGTAAMGQELYNPPDVSGWAGGEQWISSYTLLERIRLVRELVARGDAGTVCGLKIDQIIADNFISDNTELVDHFSQRFLLRPPSARLRKTVLDFLSTARGPAVKAPAAVRQELIRGVIRLILISPEYQLC